MKKTINTPQRIQSLLLLNDDKIAVGNDGDYKIRIYDINSGGLIFEMSGHTSYIESLIKLNSTHIISGSHDNTIKLWDTTIGSLSRTLYTFSAQVYSLVNLNNGFIAVGLLSTSNNLALFSTNDWSVQSYLNGHTNGVLSLLLLSNGRLLSGSYDTTAIIWK